MLTSVAIHLALAAMVSALFIAQVEPSIFNRVLVLNLKFLEASEGLTTRKKIESRVIDKAPIEATPKPIDHAASDAKLESVSVEIPANYDHALAVEPKVVATVQKNEWSTSSGQAETEQAVVARTAISLAQEKMLADKFKEWSENYYKMRETEKALSWQHEGQEYQATFRQLPANDSMGLEHVVVAVSTEENGHELSTEMRMKRLTFSNFAQFINHWDPDVLIHKDEMEGRFHSNSKISLEYTRKVQPKFHGKVTTASGGVHVTKARRRVKHEQIFLGGLETGVKKITLPKHSSPLSGQLEVADNQVKYFDDDTRITFYPDGSYGWQAAGLAAGEQRVSIAGEQHYIIGARKTKLYIKGTVAGKVLVYSPEKIVIEGDLMYAHDPDTTPNADDYLGLVSDKDIDIAHSRITGRGDLLIYASMYAQRRFVVKRYWSKENALLFIYGSLTAGSLSATEPRFHTRIQFDKRLENSRPPGFPMTDRYEIEARNDHWRIE